MWIIVSYFVSDFLIPNNMSLPVILHPENNNILKSKGVSLCAFLDTLRKRKDDTFSVRVRIIFKRFPKLYSTKINLSEEDYLHIVNSKKLKGVLNDSKGAIYGMIRKSYDIIKEMDEFSFKNFDNILFHKEKIFSKDVESYYQKAINNYKLNKQLSTASNYELSLKSLKKFHNKNKLTFEMITTQWLKDYEREMIVKNKRSQTTVGIYLRPLRAIFNTAIFDKVITNDIYPFTKREYTIPMPRGVKKALTVDQLKTLFNGEPKTSDQIKAKDIWFFSYACNGMNVKDIIELKYKNIDGDTLKFRRAKTIKSNNKQEPVTIYLSEFPLSIIEKYGKSDKSPDNYIFPFIDASDSPELQYKKLKNLTRYLNQHFRNYAKSLEINEKISSYWARHSFATNSIRKGASMEFISEALGHNNQKTTKNYFAGFADETKKEFAKNLMDF